MPKSNAANIIDLDAFRQRKLEQERASVEPMTMAASLPAQAVFVPVWFCWVPAWSPIVG